MAVQAHALRMAAEGAVAAYEQVVGETWKPFERQSITPAETVGRKAAKAADGGVRLAVGRGFGPALFHRAD